MAFQPQVVNVRTHLVINQPDKHTYRLLGWLALAHALVASALVIFFFEPIVHGSYTARAWVGLATLWFLWPIVLILHRGRSWRRCFIFVVMGMLLFLPILPAYIFHIGPPAVGLPFGVHLEPISILRYWRAWWSGRADARKDIAAGILAREVYGFGAAGGHSAKILRDRYHIETHPTAGCVVDEKIVGHAAGYNEIAEKEIDRRVGRAQVEAAKAEGLVLDRQATELREQYWTDLAQRFSIFPSDSNVTLQSVTVFKPPYTDFPPLEPALEEQLGKLVREVEKFVGERTPQSTPEAQLRVSVTLAPAKPPQFQTSGSIKVPRTFYDRVRLELPGLQVPVWNGEYLVVTLNFALSADVF